MALLLAASIFLIYGRALGFGFCIIDDDHKFIQNIYIHRFDVLRILSAHHLEFIPFTYLSFTFDVWAFGNSPTGLHAMNFLYHFLATLAAAALVGKICPGQKALIVCVALLFALHPLHVEPVVWISCRKDLLYSGFLLAAVLCYWRYLDDGRRAYQSPYFFLSMALGVASFLSKGSAVVFPALLLLVDFFSGRKRDRWMALDKAPILIGAIFLGIRQLTDHGSLTLLAGGVHSLPLALRNAFEGIVFYFSKFVLPIRLSVHYERGAVANAALDYGIFAFVCVALAGVFWRSPRSRKVLGFGILFFLITMSPYLRLIPFEGDFLVADRYFYLGGLGIFLACLFPLSQTRIGLVVSASLIVGYAILAAGRVSIWQSNRTLLQSTLSYYPASSFAELILGVVEQREKNLDQALYHFNRAYSLNPQRPGLAYLLGQAYLQKKDFSRSIEFFERALPTGRSEVYLELASAYWAVGRLADSENLLNQLISLRPWEPRPYYNLARLFLSQGDYRQAKYNLMQTIEKSPGWAIPYEELADLYERIKDPDSAQKYRALGRGLRRELK